MRCRHKLLFLVIENEFYEIVCLVMKTVITFCLVEFGPKNLCCGAAGDDSA